MIIDLDEKTVKSAQSSSGRKSLEGWAKMFFPQALEVKIEKITKL